MTKSSQDISDSLLDKTMVISGDYLPQETSQQLPAANADSANESQGNVFQAFSDLLFNRRTNPDNLIDIISDTSREIPVAADGSLPENIPGLPDVKASYNIESSPLASGGQGFISRADDRALGCIVAMKTLHAKYNSNATARQAFINEARITAELDHPAIIPIHGLFSDETNGLHLAMKLIDGYTLDKFLQRLIAIYSSNGIKRYNERKSLRNRIDILLRVCDAVSYAHHRNILHRDLKPGNIMIGRYHAAYLTDWGLALHLHEAGSLEKVSGTPGYIAPEVISEKRADVRSDIYSLGVMLFEITTLSQAFADDELPILLQKVQLGMHLPLRHRFKFRIDRDLAAIIRKAMNVDPNKRYQTVDDLALDLRKYLANEEVSARPDNLFIKITRWGVNHRTGMTTAALAVTLLGVGSIAYTLQKEIRSAITQHWLDNTASTVYINTLDVANNIENRIQNIEHKLETLQMYMRFDDLRILAPSPKKSLFYPTSKIKSAAPASFVYSPSYRHKIDTENIFIFNTLGKKDASKSVTHLKSTGEYMRQCLLETIPGHTFQMQRKVLLNGDQPAQMIYLALSDGTFACYPGINKFVDNYDPRQRSWYKKALTNPGVPQWTTPYKDAFGAQETVTTCSVAVNSVSGKFIGVAAMDFSLRKFGSQLLDNSGKYSRFVCEKMLIDLSGKVILRLPNKNRPAPGKFNDPELIKRMLAMRYGTLTDYSGPHEHLLSFATVKSLNLLYVECIDLHQAAEAIDNDLSKK